MLSNHRLAACMLVLLIPLVGQAVASAAETPSEEDPVLLALDARVARFFEGISTADTQKAFAELLVGSRLLDQKKALQELIDKTQQLPAKYGRLRDSEQIASKRVGKDLVLFRYLYKCEDFPVVWYFTFYRTPPVGESTTENAPWRVVIVRFDTELELLWFLRP